MRILWYRGHCLTGQSVAIYGYNRPSTLFIIYVETSFLKLFHKILQKHFHKGVYHLIFRGAWKLGSGEEEKSPPKAVKFCCCCCFVLFCFFTPQMDEVFLFFFFFLVSLVGKFFLQKLPFLHWISGSGWFFFSSLPKAAKVFFFFFFQRSSFFFFFFYSSG